MAALKVNSDNSITLPFPLLAIIVTSLIALVGWSNSLRTDVADLKQWKESHVREVAENKASINEQFKAMSAAMQAKSDKDEKWRAEIQETLTQIRIAVGARPATMPTPNNRP